MCFILLCISKRKDAVRLLLQYKFNMTINNLNVIAFAFSSTAKGFGAYEIVTPARVNEAGDILPTGVHYKRRKRSIDPITSNISHHWASPHVYYQISAFGQDYYLNLNLESGFIAPVYAVTILGAPSESHDSEGEEEDTEYQHCFYKGHVNSGQEHTAVISLCSGLVSSLILFFYNDINDLKLM